jgi:acetyl esterase/lipase
MQTLRVGLVIVLSLVLPKAAPAANLADFVDYTLRSPRGALELPGRLFIPPEAISDPTTPRPLMVYLHGGAAVGTNNTTQIEQTPDYLVDVAKERAAYLYVPQAPTTWASESAVDLVMKMIDRVITERNADPNRLYANGASNGGGGTWNLLSRNPKRFAAALTVASIAPLPSFNAANLLGTAIFTFHARDDATVPVARTRTVVNSILAAADSHLPNYTLASSTQNTLVLNPALSFHTALMAGQIPDSAVFQFITAPNLDLIYVETYAGGHTGLLGAFYAPPIFDWMFDHSLLSPEPNTALLIGMLLAILALQRRSH